MCTIAGDCVPVAFGCVVGREVLLVVPPLEQAVMTRMTTSNKGIHKKREALLNIRAFIIIYAIFPALLTNPRSAGGKIAEP